MRILTWNLFHGRAVPPAGVPLLDRFAERLARWEWDVALLQEVPPWWPEALAAAAGAEQRRALTSRNAALPLRRAVARRWPDFAKSNGGGANAVLSRIPIVAEQRFRLRRWPERRVAQLVRLESDECLGNYHGSTRPPLARDELARLWDLLRHFAGGAPVLLGGDLNLRDPIVPGATLLARGVVDFLFARGLAAVSEGAFLDRRLLTAQGEVELSDHRALAISVAQTAAGTAAISRAASAPRRRARRRS